MSPHPVCDCSVHREAIAGETAKVQRVLDAARAFARVWPTPDAVGSIAREVCNAIEALDAPQPRWTADDSNLFCDGKLVTSIFGKELMGVIAKLLNDQERTNAADAREGG